MKITRARRLWWALMHAPLTPILRVVQFALPVVVGLYTLLMVAAWKLWG